MFFGDVEYNVQIKNFDALCIACQTGSSSISSMVVLYRNTKNYRNGKLKNGLLYVHVFQKISMAVRTKFSIAQLDANRGICRLNYQSVTATEGI